MTMNRHHVSVIALAAAAIHAEALISPSPHCIVSHCHVAGARRALALPPLRAAPPANGSSPPADEFRPRTMQLTESAAFFARHVARTLVEARARRRRERRRWRWRRDAARPAAAEAAAGGGRGTTAGGGTLARLNRARKDLARLVGHDASLLVPSFGFLFLGALMSSVVPHFYSSCISCVVTGADRGKLLRAVAGLGAAYVLEAVFTGLRGALFWVAGEYRNTRDFDC